MSLPQAPRGAGPSPKTSKKFLQTEPLRLMEPYCRKLSYALSPGSWQEPDGEAIEVKLDEMSDEEKEQACQLQPPSSSIRRTLLLLLLPKPTMQNRLCQVSQKASLKAALTASMLNPVAGHAAGCCAVLASGPQSCQGHEELRC